VDDVEMGSNGLLDVGHGLWLVDGRGFREILDGIF
jgi:hypothetical protein